MSVALIPVATAFSTASSPSSRQVWKSLPNIPDDIVEVLVAVADIPAILLALGGAVGPQDLEKPARLDGIKKNDEAMVGRGLDDPFGPGEIRRRSEWTGRRRA